MSDLFKKNLDQAILLSPLFDDQIKKQNIDNILLIEDGKEKINLKADPIGFFHDPENPIAEAKSQWETINKTKKTIFCYGLGLAYLYEEALDWLTEDKDRALVFFESDLRIIKAFLSSHRAEKVIQNTQIKIIPLLEPDPALPPIIPETFLSTYLWPYAAHSYTFTALPSYEMNKKETYEQFQKMLTQAIQKIEISLTFINKTSYKVLVNFLQNTISSVPHTKREPLVGAFKNVPALICGAGSSILEDIELIKKLKDKALIFAGGTSVNILNSHHIDPHIGGVIDPDPNITNFMKQNSFEMPLMYKFRSGCEIISRYDGPRILTPEIYESSFHEWLSKKFSNENENTPTYWTVTDFLFHQACILGCNPIILVGVDLALTEDRYYADNSLSSMNVENIYVIKPDMNGSPIKTKPDWVYSSENINKLALKYPEKTIINATRRGLGFKDIPHETLDICASKHLRNTIDPGVLLRAYLGNSALCYPDTTLIQHTLNEVRLSFQASIELIKKTELELTSLFSNWQVKSFDELNPYVGNIKEIQDELEKELIYDKLLKPSWEIYRKSLHKTVSVPDNPLKYKLTLFGMKARELQYYKNLITTCLTIFELSNGYFRELHKDSLQALAQADLVGI